MRFLRYWKPARARGRWGWSEMSGDEKCSLNYCEMLDGKCRSECREGGWAEKCVF